MSDELEKEVVYKLDICVSKDNYMKPLYGKISRKYSVFRRITAIIILAETAALLILDRSAAIIIWSIILVLFVVLGCAAHFDKIKRYEELCAAKENCFSYTFYSDSVKIENPTIEATVNYDTAEFYAEDSERMMIFFPFDRGICVFKSQCDEEMLAFFRRIVPEENQKKVEKKTAVKFFISSAVVFLFAVVLAVMIIKQVDINANFYDPKYPASTYMSFEACLDHGTVKDVVIVKNKYVEYTYTGSGEDERYYAVYPNDDIDRLTDKLDALDVDWEFE